MGARMWVLTALFPKVAGVLISSGPVIKATRAFMAALKKGYDDIPDERVKAHLVELELRIERLEARLDGVDRSLRKIAVAVYLAGAVALAALIVALTRLT